MIYREILKIAVFFVYDLLNIRILRRIDFDAALINQIVCFCSCIPFRNKRFAHVGDHRVYKIAVDGSLRRFFFIIVIDFEILLDCLDIFFIRNKS